MPSRDESGPQRFVGHDLSDDTTETLIMRPVRGPRPPRPGAGQPRPAQDPPTRVQPALDETALNRTALDETTLHEPVRDEPGWDEAEDGDTAEPDREWDDAEPESPRGTAAPPDRSPRGSGALRTGVRTVGEIFITLGVVILLFVVYELYVTNLFSAAKQADANQALEQRWSQGTQQPERELRLDPVAGKAFARIYIPSFGVDYDFTIQEGVSSEALEVGPGHYVDSALPGRPGNFAVAGHRVGKGAPFNDLDLLSSCDAIVIETANDFYVYRVLPMQDEVADWRSGAGRRPACANVSTLRDGSTQGGGPYAETYGRRIVNPGRGDAVAGVPYRGSGVLPKSDQVALLTLTTCHPQFSAAERMIIHGVLTKQFKKTPNGGGYEQVLQRIGEA